MEMEREPGYSRAPDPDESMLDDSTSMEDDEAHNAATTDILDEDDEPVDGNMPPPPAPRRNVNNTHQEGSVPISNSNSNRKISEISGHLKKTRIFTEKGIEDDVFIGPAAKGAASCMWPGSRDDPQGRPREPEPSFPPLYNVVRANKNKAAAATALGGSFGFSRIERQQKTGFGAGLNNGEDSRVFRAQNYHCTEKGLNISFSIGRPAAGSRDEMPCLSCVVSHSFRERMSEQGLPVLIIVSDQAFPALVPATGGLCPVVIRVEDGMVDELADVLSDRFKAYTKPHGALPQGSVILIGSLTHLRTRGLADYADAVVNAGYRLGARMGANIDIVPLVPVPLGGLDEPAAVRALLDFDTWLSSSQQPVGTSLAGARRVFWEVAAAGPLQTQDGSEQIIVLPGHLKNNRKKPFLSQAFSCKIPKEIAPFDRQREEAVVHEILKEINEVYGMGLDPNPDLSRDHDPQPGTTAGRVVIIGASHMCRTAQALKDKNVCVHNLSKPGWLPDAASAASAVEAVKGLSLDEKDCVVLDIWSNSAYLGTDENGFPVKPFRSQEDNRYHVIGDLQVAPLGVFKKILGDFQGVIHAANNAAVIIVVPFPRYLVQKCCDSDEHVTNIGQDSYASEVGDLTDLVAGLLSGSGLGDNVTSFSLSRYLSGADPSAVNRHLSLENVCSWADPVHLSSEIYTEAAGGILEARAQLETEPAKKRPRLESVAPTANPKSKGKVMLPGWVMGRGPSPIKPSWQVGKSGGRGWPSTRARGGYRGRGRGRGGRYY